MVYPHVCGAARGEAHEAVFDKGLSPRVWGSLWAIRCRGLLAGSIPTCVGQPTAAKWWSWIDGVYPHVCGAAFFEPANSTLQDGLSPRVWGSQVFATCMAKATVSIPTCVGQPHWHSAAAHCVEVYPHVCGAALMDEMEERSLSGLSPRVWGSHTGAVGDRCNSRSIPTCVGQPDAGLGVGVAK